MLVTPIEGLAVRLWGQLYPVDNPCTNTDNGPLWERVPGHRSLSTNWWMPLEGPGTAPQADGDTERYLSPDPD